MEKQQSSRRRRLSCITRSKNKPRIIQERVIDYIYSPLKSHDGLLVVHGTGCGKTLSAVIASQCYLDRYPQNKVIFIAPASLITNFQNELATYNLGEDRSMGGGENKGGGESKYSRTQIRHLDKYHMYSFERFQILKKQGRPVNCRNSMLIVDEAHNLRGLKSKRAEAVFQCAQTAHKRLLLTATPFINNATDLVNLINLIYGYEIVSFLKGGAPYSVSKEFSKQTIRTLEELLRGRVDYVPSCRGTREFPTVEEEFLATPMTLQYKEAYEKAISGVPIAGILIKNPRVFLHGYRKAVNKAGADKYFSVKLATAIDKIKKHGKIQRSVIFTNWIEYGVRTIRKLLKKEKIPFRVFRGGLKAVTKQEIVDQFNEGVFPVLVVTRAGGEGLDLKKVRNLIILDPVWHDAGTQQITGRAVRYRSHAGLKKADRHVRVFKMVLTYPGVKNWQPGMPTGVKTGDQMLYEIIERKKKASLIIARILKKVSINRNISPKPFRSLMKDAPRRKYKTMTKKQLSDLTMTDLKKLCKEVGMGKRTTGESLASFKKSDKNKLITKFMKFVRQ